MSCFVGTLKNEISGAALELYQIKIKHFSPDILKFSTKHKDNPFTLNCFVVPHTFLFIFCAGSHRLGSNKYRTKVLKKQRLVQPMFPDSLFISYDYTSAQHRSFLLNIAELLISYYEENLWTATFIRSFFNKINLRQSAFWTICSFKVLISEHKYKSNIKDHKSQKKYQDFKMKICPF